MALKTQTNIGKPRQRSALAPALITCLTLLIIVTVVFVRPLDINGIKNSLTEIAGLVVSALIIFRTIWKEIVGSISEIEPGSTNPITRKTNRQRAKKIAITKNHKPKGNNQQRE